MRKDRLVGMIDLFAILVVLTTWAFILAGFPA